MKNPLVDKKSLLKVAIVLLFSCTSGCNFTNKTAEKDLDIAKNNNYVRGELEVQHGMELFNLHCASCHNFQANEIGPNLSGVTSAVDKEWLVAFIKDPKATITSGDPRAKALYDRYKLYMPTFTNFSATELEDLLGFIHKFSEAEKKNNSTRVGGLLDPIAAKIPTSDLNLVIEEWLTIPKSSETGPMARINKMSGIRTKHGDRLFLADLRGKLHEITKGEVRTYLDLNEEVEKFIDHPGWGTGLGSFAFHPDFERNGLLYTTHTEPAKTVPADFAINDSIKVALQWVLMEWKTEHPDADKFTGKKRELLRTDMIGSSHGFQELTFNPLAKRGDSEYGLLYLCIGDGSAALSGYPFLCDNASNIWGSVIRIDPAGRNSNNGKYGIPINNPFAKEAGSLGEIWARGFRNPHRISWDQSGSGKMFISNIGQHSVEEVNLGKIGADYGWPNREGTFLYDTEANTELVYPIPENDGGYTYPVLQFDHDEGNAVSGGFVYAGTKIPALKGKYIFGDIPRGTIFYSEVSQIIEGQQAPIFKMGVEMNGANTDMGAITQNDRVDLRFGIDNDGELYIFTKSNGKVYKVVGPKTDSL